MKKCRGAAFSASSATCCEDLRDFKTVNKRN